jgi:hypothetical protein
MLMTSEESRVVFDEPVMVIPVEKIEFLLRLTLAWPEFEYIFLVFCHGKHSDRHIVTLFELGDTLHSHRKITFFINKFARVRKVFRNSFGVPIRHVSRREARPQKAFVVFVLDIDDRLGILYHLR